MVEQKVVKLIKSGNTHIVNRYILCIVSDIRKKMT